MDDDLVARYAAEAKAAMEAEAARRVSETTDPAEEERLRNLSLFEVQESEHFVPALLARLGAVRAALDGHGGGIAVSQTGLEGNQLDLVLDLTGRVSHAVQHLEPLKASKPTLRRTRKLLASFSSALLDTFDDLGREFILAHGAVEFVDMSSTEPSD